ncbi:MAG: hypothetical protein ACK5QW_08515 [Cyanobacteriota bacterium]
MLSTPSLGSPIGTNRSTPCRRCGGSGILRLADGRFRTCLDCLGQGFTAAAAHGPATAAAGSAHARSFRSPNEEGSCAHDRGQGSGGQQQEKDGGPVCVHPGG